MVMQSYCLKARDVPDAELYRLKPGRQHPTRSRHSGTAGASREAMFKEPLIHSPIPVIASEAKQSPVMESVR